jgi:hypothetical protein
MRTMVAAVGAVAILAGATLYSRGGDSVSVSSTIVAGAPISTRPAYPTEPYPGYIAYADYDVTVPAPGCYWTRLPVYDNARTVVGWLGRPIAVCPEGL